MFFSQFFSDPRRKEDNMKFGGNRLFYTATVQPTQPATSPMVTLTGSTSTGIIFMNT
jgi:hypothetical protein